MEIKVHNPNHPLAYFCHFCWYLVTVIQSDNVFKCLVSTDDLVSLSLSFVFSALSKCIFLWNGFKIPGIVRFYLTMCAEVELIFFPVTDKGLFWDYPEHRLRIQRCFYCCWAGLTQSQNLSCFSSSCAGREWECMEGQEEAQDRWPWVTKGGWREEEGREDVWSGGV